MNQKNPRLLTLSQLRRSLEDSVLISVAKKSNVDTTTIAKLISGKNNNFRPTVIRKLSNYVIDRNDLRRNNNDHPLQ